MSLCWQQYMEARVKDETQSRDFIEGRMTINTNMVERALFMLPLPDY